MADKRLGRDEAARQMAAADKRIKGISSIASSTVKRAKILDVQKQYGTNVGNQQAVTSVDRALRSLAKSTEALAHGVKTITVETARGVKNITASGAKAMGEYAKAISEDISINRQNFMVLTIGKFTPLVGYAVAKMMETAVFRNMIAKMREGLSRALNAVTSRFKKLAMAGWDRGKELWDSFRDKISGKRGAVKTRMANARSSKKDKTYFTKESAIKDALADAKISAAIKEKSKKKDIEKRVPHMATGGFVKKEGLAKIHAAEVVQPIDKLVETIVKSVTEAMDKKEGKKGGVFGSQSYFQKAKKKDLFGFEKVSHTINRAFDIMTRKSLRLETRIMKRDKVERKGLIKSFMSAYSEEAKQDEIPLMERQVRATLELKKTISGENKTFSAAISKMLYEHPMFHGALLMFKGLRKSITLPFKFMFKKRGGSSYSGDLSSSGTVFEQMANSLGLLYSGIMGKLDSITANTYVTANATAKGKGGSSGARPAPGQKKSWSFAGILYKGLVKKPAEGLEWLAKKYMPKGKFKSALTTGWGDAWKNSWDQTKSNARRRGRGVVAGLGAAKDWAKGKADDLSQSKYGDIYRISKRRRDNLRKMRQYQNSMIRKNKLKRATSWMGDKLRSGKKSSSGLLEKIANNTKKQLKETIDSKYNNSAWFKKLIDNGKSIWERIFGFLAPIFTTISGFVSNISGFISGLPLKIAGTFGSLIPKLFRAGGIITSIGAAIGPAIMVALAGAAGAAIGTWMNNHLIKPVTDKLYAHTDKKNKEAYESSDKAVSSNIKNIKDYQQGKGTKENAQVSNAALKASLDINNQQSKVKDDFGMFSGVNFPRVSGGQKKYVEEHAAEYVNYGPSQVSSLRDKWIKAKVFNRGKSFFGETWEDYGAKREESFLSYLKANGKPLSQEKLDSETSRVITQKNPSAKPPPKGIATGISETNSTRINDIQKTAVALLPLAAQFTGSQATVGLLAGWVQDKSNANPTALASVADKIVRFGEKEFYAAGGDPEVFNIAKTISSNKKGFLELSKSKIKNITDTIGITQKILSPAEMELRRGSGGANESLLSKTSNTTKELLKQGSNKLSEVDFAKLEKQGKGIAGKASSAFNMGKGYAGDIADNASAMYSDVTKTRALDNDERHNGGRRNTIVDTMKDKANKAIMDLPWTLDSMAKGLMSSLSDIGSFFSKAYGDPVAFYNDTKERLWGGIDKVREHAAETYNKLHDMYMLAKNEAIYQWTTRTAAGDPLVGEMYEGSSLSQITALGGAEFKIKGSNGKPSKFNLKTHPGETVRIYNAEDSVARDRGYGGGITGRQVAAMGARQDLGKADLANGTLEAGFKGVKDSVEKTGRQSANMMHSVINNSSNITSNTSNSGGGGSSSSQRPIDSFVQSILLCNI